MLLLDTCAVIWFVQAPESMTRKALERIQSPEETVFVSAITAGELACLSSRGRLKLDRHWKTWFRHWVDYNGWNVLPLTWEVMEEAYSLPGEFHSDPADRAIVATARLHKLSIVTGDRLILDYPHVETIW